MTGSTQNVSRDYREGKGSRHRRGSEETATRKRITFLMCHTVNAPKKEKGTLVPWPGRHWKEEKPVSPFENCSLESV